MQKSMQDKVVFITGASRGIGREIALKCAEAGANIIIAAKTTTPHPKLKGTIFSVKEEIESLGVKALAVELDVREEEMVKAAVDLSIQTFGKIDALVNNASAINLEGTEAIAMKRYDLISSVNGRGTFICSKYCIPHLKKSANPHILNLSPPLSMKAKWFKNHLAYTMSKYGMSMCTLGMSEEFKEDGIAVNSLWPKTLIATAAISVNFPPELYNACRKPNIVADAALAILTSASRKTTGNFFIDEEVLLAAGIKDLHAYALNPSASLHPDLYIE